MAGKTLPFSLLILILIKRPLTMDTLLIEIPSHIEDDDELADWVRGNSEAFWPAMDLDASQHDDRANVDEVNITEVEIDERTVAIHYDYEYSAYYGCRDVNYSDTTDEEVIVGQRQGNTLLFEKFKPRERRSSDEEF